MGRSCELKKLKNAEKVKRGQVKRGPTDRRTDIAGCRVASHATKKKEKNKNRMIEKRKKERDRKKNRKRQR